MFYFMYSPLDAHLLFVQMSGIKVYHENKAPVVIIKSNS